ncbi:MAG: hypothetical protein H7Z40_10795 [Phycisphaerae bacterium]|nr:hypothetical protein [Gemmatimonadaceae bacterium]
MNTRHVAAIAVVLPAALVGQPITSASPANKRQAGSAAAADVGADARQDQILLPINNGKSFRTLDDSTLFPEGMSHDARTGTVYVSSLHHHNIMALSRSGGSRWLMPQVLPNVGGIYGIAVDTARGIIWATSAAAPGTSVLAASDSALPALLEVRLADGKQLRRWEMRSAAPITSPGDIALSPTGDVLVSDSQAGVLWLLPAGGDTLIAIRHRLFRSLQGLVPSRDGKAVWVADYSHGLLRVELPGGATTRVADLAGHTTVGIDGLVAHGNTLIGVQNLFNPAQVVQLTLNAEGTRIVKHAVLDRNVLATSPTGGIVIDYAVVHIANSLWDFVGQWGTVTQGVRLPKPLLLRLPLTSPPQRIDRR